MSARSNVTRSADSVLSGEDDHVENVIAPRSNEDELKDQLLDAYAEKQEEYSDQDHTESKVAQDVEMNLAEFAHPSTG